MFRLTSPASAAASSAFPQARLSNYRAAGMVVVALLLHLQYPLSDTPAAGSAPTLAQIDTLLNAGIGTFTLSYGEALSYKPYAGVQGQDIHHTMQAVYGEQAVASTPSNAATQTVTADVLVPFETPILADNDNRLRCPGITQVRTMAIDMIEGAAMSGTYGGETACGRQAGANTVVDICAICVPGEDHWTPILSFYKVQGTDYYQEAPEGLHLVAWDANTAFSGAPTTWTPSAYVDGQAIMETAPIYQIDDSWSRDWVSSASGTANLDTTMTMLVVPKSGQKTSQLPNGKLKMYQPAMSVATWKLQGLYWPPLLENEAKEAARLGSMQYSTGVLLHAIEEAGSADPKYARTLPVKFAKPTDDEFHLAHGLKVDAPGKQPYVHIPEHTQAAAKAQVAAAGKSGSTAAEAAKSSIMGRIAQSIPGMAQYAAAAKAMGTHSARATSLGQHFERLQATFL